MTDSQIPNLIRIENEVMTNFDHSIDYKVAELLKDGKHYAQYSAWNFCGWVYFNIQKQLFIYEVWRYHLCEEIFEYSTLELIMENVCRGYGDG